jgi:hypothetical protein
MPNMIATKDCVCGQKLEFEQEDAPYINCPSCGRRVSDLFDPVTAAAAPEPLKEGAAFANVAGAKEGKTPPPLPRANGLFVIVGDETKGPYSLKQIKAMYESGQLTMDTRCCREGDENWRSLVDFENEFYQDDHKTKQATPPPMPQVVHFTPATPKVRGEGLHPAVAALLGFCCLTGLAQMVMGQGGKGLLILVGAVIMGIGTGGIAFFIVHPIVAIDAIMVAQALRSGRGVGRYEFFPSS